MNEPASAAAQRGLRLLVVEDDWMVAEHIVMMAEDLGFAVVGPVATIDEAMANIESEALDGVLLDANLNGESSAPIAVYLQSRAIPFVVVTGYGALELPTEAMNSAPRLAKPFSASDFESTLVAAFCPDAS